MFNTTIHKAGNTFHQVEVTEKRAPTDESVKLLREMEEAARNSIQLVTEVSPNEMTYRWWVLHESGLDSYKVKCRFAMNGKEHEFEIDYCQRDWMMRGGTMQTIAQEVRAKVIEKLATILTVDLFEKNSRTLFQRNTPT